MKHLSKIIAALCLLVFVSYIFYGFYTVTQVMFDIRDVEEKYSFTPKDSDLTLVEFTQYHDCAHCKSINRIINDAIKSDGKVRYAPRIIAHGKVFEEYLASVPYAAAEQRKFTAFHRAIIQRGPIKDRDFLFALAEALEINTEKLSRDMAEPALIDRMREDQEHMDFWNISALPALIIFEGDRIYLIDTNDLTTESLTKKFTEIRNKRTK